MKSPLRKNTKETFSNTVFRGDDEGSGALSDLPWDAPASRSRKASLKETQGLMFSALLEPLSGRSRSQTELSESSNTLSSGFRQVAAQIIRDGPNLSALEGLELYHRQYWFRLLDSLEEDFPETRRFLGEERFWNLLESYLIAHPSRSYTLRHLGRAMADHVASHPEVTLAERPWVTSISRLEYALMEADEAPSLTKPAPEDFLSCSLMLQPYVQLLTMEVPCVAWIADDTADWEKMSPQSSCVVVWRSDDGDAQFDTESLNALPLLEAFQQPGTLGEILGRVDLTGGVDASVFQEWFARWQARGWFAIADARSA
jgi:hypothetical protein